MKKKIMIIVSVCLLMIIGFVSWNKHSEYKAEQRITKLAPSNYRVNLKDTTEIDVDGLDKAVNGKLAGDYYIFIGRPTCPYCRKFSPVVNKLSKNNKIYYFNTDANQTTEKLKKIVKQQLKIQTVPYITYVHDGKVAKGISDSSASIERVESLAK